MEALNAFYTILPGLDEEGGADPLSSPAARRTGHPTSTKMLVPTPYKVPKKTAEKEAKKTRGGLRRCSTSDTICEGSNAHPASEEDDEEEDESPAGGRKKRTTSANLEAELPKRGK